ncbi:unnamed protein product [Rotaria sp. Silwood2]|nr:unnamed protein product [Rotaria sp. Silwood2]
MVQPNKTKNSGKISSNRRNRSDKITTFEQLSSEIFYEIFDYLTGNEIYGSFFGLNKRINDLLYNKPNIHLDFTRSTRKFYNSFQRIFCTQNIISIVSDCSIETILQRLHDSAGGGRLKSISLPYLPLHMFHTKIPEILSGLKQQLVSLKIELMNEWSYGTESQTALSFQYLLTELPALKYFGLNGSDQIDSITYLDPSIVNKTVISLSMSISDHVRWTHILYRFENLKLLTINFRFTNDKKRAAPRDSTSYFGNQIHEPLPISYSPRLRHVKIYQYNLILENIELLFQLLISSTLLTLRLFNCQRPFTRFPQPKRQPPFLDSSSWHSLVKKYLPPTMKRFFVEYEDVDNIMSMTNLVQVKNKFMKYSGSDLPWKVACAYNQKTKSLSFDFIFT